MTELSEINYGTYSKEGARLLFGPFFKTREDAEQYCQQQITPWGTFAVKHRDAGKPGPSKEL